ncbi:DegT/DnrJ/EryC1/StrS family aminotransferase [Paramagnetospirillum magneticum]|uniref:Predicted pyridoxal phosphate-dependent enzyme n=1 Tax=Paramagnetospirillum magneticum (strain ATCC 700264 / AMB-1) TaxID=342108 RepID=Q2WBB9_PARM1|nr:DegT/DnrJ/EryC1/StrS family aminotransferase [Paramagnetospirillum magneticum]BAE48856.1 Predicted pyridoxal phosphate-dependent enzyme [Paramagnetospirillum magneticum AMB-1]
MILFSNPGAQVQAHRAEIDQAIARVLDSGWYVLGREVEAFEREFAEYLGTAHAVGVNSGTDALALALRALGIGPGDQVAAPSHTAVATIAAIEMVGAEPLLVDIDPVHYTMDPVALEAAVTPRTRAVVIVHLYGQAADMDAVLGIARRHGLKVVEDCAQATGGRYKGRRLGTLGDVGCFSFYPTKNLGAVGDGGAVVTGSEAVAQSLRSLREYGWRGDRISHVAGVNSRLDELQAAILRAKLPHLDADNDRRRVIAGRYDAELSSVLSIPVRRSESHHVFHLYVVRLADRDAMVARLRGRGIGASIHYAQAAHQQPAYEARLAGAGNLPQTERAVAEIMTLPIYPELSDEEVGAVISAIRTELAGA